MPDFPFDFGAYRLLAELGRGGNGIVYKAEHKALGRTVALKVLQGGSDWIDEETLQRFRREGQIMAKLTHPDIVAVYDYGKHEDRLYIAMEMVTGESLDRYVKSQFPPVEESIRIVSRIARALQVAHESGVVHRDLKPHNVIIDRAGNPKLADFGLAKTEGTHLTRTGGLLGTPMYMSPEQASGRGHHADARSDIYSLGAVMYELLTGAPPYTGTTIEGIVHQVIHEDPMTPRNLDPKIPKDLETICLKAMAKAPQDRYPTAKDFADDLDRFLGGDTIIARPAGIVERSWKWLRRKRVTVAIVLLSLAAAGGGIGMALHFQKRLREQQAAQQRVKALDDLAIRADDWYRKKRYREALSALSDLRGTERETPEHKLRRAICFRETGRHDDADREFADYLSQFPDDAAGWRQRGLNALAADDLRTAVDSYREAGVRGRVARVPEAIRNEDFDAVISLVEAHFLPSDPEFGRPFVAGCYPDFFRPGYEEPHTHGMMADDPPDPYGLDVEWRRAFGKLVGYSFPPKVAEPYLERYGPHPFLLALRGFYSGPESSDGLADFDEAIRLAPNSRGLRYYRHKLFLLRGWKAQADAEWERTLQLAPSDVTIWFNKACHLRKRKDFAAAAEGFRRIGEEVKGGMYFGFQKPFMLYRMAARCFAQAGDARSAVDMLSRMHQDHPCVRTDFDLEKEYDPIRDSAEFKAFLRSLPEE